VGVGREVAQQNGDIFLHVHLNEQLQKWFATGRFQKWLGAYFRLSNGAFYNIFCILGLND